MKLQFCLLERAKDNCSGKEERIKPGINGHRMLIDDTWAVGVSEN